MAARRGESEGINLISSTYSDDDDEMEDMQHQQEPPIDDDANDTKTTTTTTPNDDDDTRSNRSNDTPPISNGTVSRPLTPQQLSLSSPPQPPQAVLVAEASRSRMGRLTIVDYGHDEAALSPEAEEGEITGTGVVTIGAQLQMTNVDIQEPSGTTQTPSTQAVTPQLSELDASDSHLINSTVNESRSVEVSVTVSVEVAEDIDPLDRFLPPPPTAKCSDELQRRIEKFLEVKKRRGISYNAEVRNKKEYRNPDFLLHAVTYQEIDQIGSCFSKDVFDPHGYDKSDYYDEIEADMKREMERKEQEKKKNQKVDFITAGAQLGVVAPSPKLNITISGLSTVAAGGLHSVTAAVDSMTRDGRQNKKSKWDKVDGDRRNVLPPGGHDSVSVTGAHAALLTAANAGTGYTAFALTGIQKEGFSSSLLEIVLPDFSSSLLGNKDDVKQRRKDLVKGRWIEDHDPTDFSPWQLKVSHIYLSMDGIAVKTPHP
ncbi:hypothetical protein RHMOL_Rhmol13G0250300 [Rhododendron molle]|uniref:Uncharacterized protein n=1 Tax=Rhododendron molle TaxID=49168 RepID=A0ACC0LBI9_RHOML|nr:hypothetical protein RHMOL_Rhmol13G0250300 [Rhododendron molle]